MINFSLLSTYVEVYFQTLAAHTHTCAHSIREH